MVSYSFQTRARLIYYYAQEHLTANRPSSRGQNTFLGTFMQEKTIYLKKSSLKSVNK